MNCPICSSDSRVLRTDNGARRRECLRCKHRFSTIEVRREDHERIRNITERAKALAHDLLEA